MKSVKMLAAAMLIGFTGVAGAQDAPAGMPGVAETARISGGSYAVDPDHSQITWTVDHMGFSPLSGMFGNMSGTLTLDPKAPDASSVEIVIPVEGLVVTSEGFGKHLASAELFDAEKFPNATFKSGKVTVDGTKATIEGELTIRDVTKPIVLEAVFFGAGVNPMDQKENVGFTATGTLKRSDFGLGFAAPVVADEVTLNIVGAFHKAP